jgi:hypothetical protein
MSFASWSRPLASVTSVPVVVSVAALARSNTRWATPSTAASPPAAGVPPTSRWTNAGSAFRFSRNLASLKTTVPSFSSRIPAPHGEPSSPTASDTSVRTRLPRLMSPESPFNTAVAPPVAEV